MMIAIVETVMTVEKQLHARVESSVTDVMGGTVHKIN